jgi:hypothetical protein
VRLAQAAGLGDDPLGETVQSPVDAGQPAVLHVVPVAVLPRPEQMNGGQIGAPTVHEVWATVDVERLVSRPRGG